jgi:hypothetical protein
MTEWMREEEEEGMEYEEIVITDIMWCWVCVENLSKEERINGIVKEVKPGIFGTARGNGLWGGVAGGIVRRESSGLPTRRRIGVGIEGWIEGGGKCEEVEINMEAIHGALDEEGYVECRWVGNEDEGEVGKVHFRVKCREEEEGSGDWEGLTDIVRKDDGGWIGGDGMDGGEEEEDSDEEDGEEDGGGSNIVKKKKKKGSGIFCDVWVAPVKQYTGDEIKQWASKFGPVDSVAKEEGKPYAIVRFGEERAADWCMKIQRLKNMSRKKREREESSSPNSLASQSGPTDWTCGLCCNFNFKSKTVCNKPGCQQTQEDNKATYNNFERADWKCHSCGNNNFKSRAVCYSYGCSVTQGEAWLEAQKSQGPGYKVQRVLTNKADWTCKKCGHFNFKSKLVCYVTGCDMTQERNREAEAGGEVDDEDETDEEDEELGEVWEGGHKIGNDRVDCRYAETGGKWKERRRIRKEARKAALKHREAEVEREARRQGAQDPMKILLDAIKTESWGNAFFGVCRGWWRPSEGEVKDFVEGGTNVVVLKGGAEGGSRWTCDVVGGPREGDRGNTPSLGHWGKGKAKRVEVKDLRNVKEGRVVEVRAKIGNVESVRCRGFCGKCGGEIKSRGGGDSDSENDDEMYFKRPLPRGGRREDWGPKEWGETKELMGMPMNELAAMEREAKEEEFTKRYEEGKKNWGIFSKCKNGCSPVFWGWRWEVIGTLDGGFGTAKFVAEGESGRRLIGDMGVDVEKVERGGGAMFMQTKPLSKDIREILRTMGGVTVKGEIGKLLDTKQGAEYEVYMVCKNVALLRSCRNRLLKEAMVYFVSRDGPRGELVDVEVDVTMEELDGRGQRICAKATSKGRGVEKVKIVGWRGGEGEALRDLRTKGQGGGGDVVS